MLERKLKTSASVFVCVCYYYCFAEQVLFVSCFLFFLLSLILFRFIVCYIIWKETKFGSSYWVSVDEVIYCNRYLGVFHVIVDQELK